MKKILLLSLSCAVALGSFAKNSRNSETLHLTQIANGNHNVINPYSSNGNIARKITGIQTDTIPYFNNTDSNMIYNAVAFTAGVDSGVFTGVNALGYSGFAERYVQGATPAGYSTTIVGVLSFWAGVVNTNSTNTMTCTIWTVDSTEVTDPAYPTWKITALPGTQLYAQAIPVSQLSPGTPITTMFNTPVTVTNDFYAGYIPSYTFSQANGDTVGLFTTPIDSSNINGGVYINSNNDTVEVGTNITKVNGNWIDNYWDLNYNTDYSIVPIVQIVDSTAGVGVTKNNVTIFGNYPNPAVNTTNIRFSLHNSADVTVQIMDMQGRAINTIQNNSMSAGEHIITVSTANMPAGNYIYYIHTSDGSKLASEFAVVK